MTLQRCESLIMAEHVLNLVQNCKQASKLGGLAECYSNGREQGFKIFMIPGDVLKTIYFAQDRHTDDVVVYCGGYAMEGLSKSAWRRRSYFKTESAAAEFIISEIENTAQAHLYRVCKRERIDIIPSGDEYSWLDLH